MSEQKVCPTCGTEYPLSERFCPRDGTALRSTDAQADLLGSIIAERYHILRKLGEGGMGTVYLAEHVKMGRKAALKVMNPGMTADTDAIARFNREAANASRLNHPNVCGIYDFGETPEGLIYLAMEYIEGESLTSLIAKSGALAPQRAAAIIHQAADALAVAHDYGIVHRDLKPDNIMIAKGRDNTDLVKVVDFGIAKASASDAQKVTKTGLVVGTPEYMSPEQLAGDKLDGRSDIYSLGLVAFNCLTGKLPFPSESAQEAMIMRLTDEPKTLAEMKADAVWPPALQAVMDKALARDVNDRYQKASEFGRELTKAVAGIAQARRTSEATQLIDGREATGVAASRGAGGASSAKTVEAPASSAKTVAAPVPKTRVAAPATTSKTPMLVGIGVVAILAVGGAVMMMKGMTGVGRQKAGSPAAGGAAPVNADSGKSGTASDAKIAAGAPNTLSNPPVAPAPGGQVEMNSKGLKKVPADGRSEAPAPPAGRPANAYDPAADIAAIQTLTIVGSEAEAARALPMISALLPKLRNGDDSATVQLERAHAYISIDGNSDRACPILLKIRDNASVARGVAHEITSYGCK